MVVFALTVRALHRTGLSVKVTLVTDAAGFIDTPACAQSALPDGVQLMVTDDAPAFVLPPPPLISPLVVRFHLCVCPEPRPSSVLLLIVMTSKTKSPVVEETVIDGDELLLEAELYVPKGDV